MLRLGRIFRKWAPNLRRGDDIFGLMRRNRAKWRRWSNIESFLLRRPTGAARGAAAMYMYMWCMYIMYMYIETRPSSASPRRCRESRKSS